MRFFRHFLCLIFFSLMFHRELLSMEESVSTGKRKRSDSYISDTSEISDISENSCISNISIFFHEDFASLLDQTDCESISPNSSLCQDAAAVSLVSEKQISKLMAAKIKFSHISMRLLTGNLQGVSREGVETDKIRYIDTIEPLNIEYLGVNDPEIRSLLEQLYNQRIALNALEVEKIESVDRWDLYKKIIALQNGYDAWKLQRSSEIGAFEVCTMDVYIDNFWRHNYEQLMYDAGCLDLYVGFLLDDPADINPNPKMKSLINRTLLLRHKIICKKISYASAKKELMSLLHSLTHENDSNLKADLQDIALFLKNKKDHFIETENNAGHQAQEIDKKNVRDFCNDIFTLEQSVVCKDHLDVVLVEQKWRCLLQEFENSYYNYFSYVLSSFKSIAQSLQAYGVTGLFDEIKQSEIKAKANRKGEFFPQEQQEPVFTEV